MIVLLPGLVVEVYLWKLWLQTRGVFWGWFFDY